MAESFFDHPVLNSPYAYPGRHWQLDADGQPTSAIEPTRRRSELITPEVERLLALNACCGGVKSVTRFPAGRARATEGELGGVRIG